MAVKRTTAMKKTASKGPAKKTTAKKTPAKKTAAKNVKKPAAKREAPVREMNPDTGFALNTDQDAIATALMNGGASRAEIIEQLESTLESETRNGTPKQIPNMVSGVLNKMLANGYTVESSFQVVAPTPASKRAATRAANKTATPAKKTPAKKAAANKTAAKGRGASKRK